MNRDAISLSPSLSPSSLSFSPFHPASPSVHLRRGGCVCVCYLCVCVCVTCVYVCYLCVCVCMCVTCVCVSVLAVCV